MDRWLGSSKPSTSPRPVKPVVAPFTSFVPSHVRAIVTVLDGDQIGSFTSAPLRGLNVSVMPTESANGLPPPAEESSDMNTERIDIDVTVALHVLVIAIPRERKVLPLLLESFSKSIHPIVGAAPNPPEYAVGTRNGKRPVALVIVLAPIQHVPSDLSTPDAVRE